MSNDHFTSSLFGKFADTSLARKVMSQVATWPRETKHVTYAAGSFAHVVNSKSKKHEARNHPAVEWLLDTLVPALCQRDSTPFRLMAEAIDAQNANAFPSKQEAAEILSAAYELAGLPPPFNMLGEARETVGEDSEISPADATHHSIRIPITESELRRVVEKRLGYEINPGTFTRQLGRLNIKCKKKPNSGERGNKARPLLQSLAAKQKTKQPTSRKHLPRSQPE
jgi:hypothetical protein